MEDGLINSAAVTDGLGDCSSSNIIQAAYEGVMGAQSLVDIDQTIKSNNASVLMMPPMEGGEQKSQTQEKISVLTLQQPMVSGSAVSSITPATISNQPNFVVTHSRSAESMDQMIRIEGKPLMTSTTSSGSSITVHQLPKILPSVKGNLINTNKLIAPAPQTAIIGARSTGKVLSPASSGNPAVRTLSRISEISSSGATVIQTTSVTKGNTFFINSGTKTMSLKNSPIMMGKQLKSMIKLQPANPATSGYKIVQGSPSGKSKALSPLLVMEKKDESCAEVNGKVSVSQLPDEPASIKNANVPPASIKNANVPPASIKNANVPPASIKNANVPPASIKNANVPPASTNACLPGAIYKVKTEIASLPGSDLKFKKNEHGGIEPVTEEEMKASKPSEGGSDQATGKTMFCCCENCGMYGLPNEFVGTGRFCSKQCIGANANKKGILGKKFLVDKTAVAGQKKKKRKIGEHEMGTNKFKCVEIDGVKMAIKLKCKPFCWSSYLEMTDTRAAPSKLFRDPFPDGKNGFRVSSKLEGIDPKNCSLYCALSISEVKGYRIRLHFEGYSDAHDFWTNANSPFIFPCGWVERNGKKLQPPKGYSSENFNWSTYLKEVRAQAAPKNLFINAQTSVTPQYFRVGMKLEAVDKENSTLHCVASVADVLGERILVHFNGWAECYGYWVEPSSPYIHPVGWCQENGKPLSPPNDWPDIKNFSWDDYLTKTKSSIVPARAFKTRSPAGFDVGMKLECVDPRNTVVIRPSTVTEVKGFMLKIHFDGWPSEYDFWCDDDSPDIHPIYWCEKTGHPLQQTVDPLAFSAEPAPGVCPTPGCEGLGHVKGARYLGHQSALGCPYSATNMHVTSTVDRLTEEIVKVENEEETLADRLMQVTALSMREQEILQSGRPLVGKGSGRGRKKKKIMQFYSNLQKSDERTSSAALHDSDNADDKELSSESESSMRRSPSGSNQSTQLSEKVIQAVQMDHRSDIEKSLKLYLLPCVAKMRAADVKLWNCDQVATFVGSLVKCSECPTLFKEQQIDGEAFLMMTQQDMVNILKIKLGPAIKIFNAVEILKSSVTLQAGL